jgi:hypothetical protein
MEGRTLSDAYIDAWQEWSEQDAADWAPTTADGLGIATMRHGEIRSNHLAL